MEEELALTKMNDSHRTPNKQYAKPAAEPEDQATPPSPETNRRRLRKQEHKTEQMKKLFETFTENTHKKLREQGEKHAMEITVLIPQVRLAHKIPHLPLGDDSSPWGR
jgi:hypothetical protein